MRLLKLAFLAIMGLVTLTACSNTCGAAPVPTSHQYQDSIKNQRLNPDVAQRHGG